MPESKARRAEREQMREQMREEVGRLRLWEWARESARTGRPGPAPALPASWTAEGPDRVRERLAALAEWAHSQESERVASLQAHASARPASAAEPAPSFRDRVARFLFGDGE